MERDEEHVGRFLKQSAGTTDFVVCANMEVVLSSGNKERCLGRME